MHLLIINNCKIINVVISLTALHYLEKIVNLLVICCAKLLLLNKQINISFCRLTGRMAVCYVSWFMCLVDLFLPGQSYMAPTSSALEKVNNNFEYSGRFIFTGLCQMFIFIIYCLYLMLSYTVFN